jgi:hypothetical protein
VFLIFLNGENMDLGSRIMTMTMMIIWVLPNKNPEKETRNKLLSSNQLVMLK